MTTIKYILILCLLSCHLSNTQLFISNKPWGQLGDNIMSFAIAKAISKKHHIEFYYSKFNHSDLFLFDELEPVIPDSTLKLSLAHFSNVFEYDKHTQEYQDLSDSYLLYTYCLTPCGSNIEQDTYHEIKKTIQLKEKININILPKNAISIGVHIRKGNGGGEIYDGELTSIQLFDFDRSQLKYHTVNTCPFESLKEYNICQSPLRCYMDSEYTLLSLKFPPEQFYIDQIIKISNDLHNPRLAVLIVTDDRNPIDLIERIKINVNKSNITYHYLDNRDKGHKQKIAEDLHFLASCDGLIRSQSNFAKIAEIMGNHKFIFFAGNHKWIDNKMIITDIAIKNYIQFIEENLVKLN